MSALPEIGRCAVCLRPARLEGGGCAECVARLGGRFVATARRVREDPRFRSMCVAAIRDAFHRVLFVEYFGEPGKHPPPAPRGPLER